MSWKIPSSFPSIILSSVLFLYLYSILLPQSPTSPTPISPSCDLFHGTWKLSSTPPPFLYNESCPFHRNAWNCLRNKRRNMDLINSYQWVPNGCQLQRINPHKFLDLMRNKNVGFVGDSLNENFLVALLCTLMAADSQARKWKRKGAWKGAYFPNYNATVAYHRAVLLSNYEWVAKQSGESGGFYRVDVDIPAKEWINTSSFYDVLVFNTGHWWNHEKFPKETPLVFYESGHPITPPLSIPTGLQTVVHHTVTYVETHFRKETLKFWRLQSPRHFHGGEWNQNGTCVFERLLTHEELDTWFERGVNKEAREVNRVILEGVKGTSFEVLDVTHLSEFRADGHPAIWLGKEGAVKVWGEDCMHWCLPGIPDTWVDILGELIRVRFQSRGL